MSLLTLALLAFTIFEVTDVNYYFDGKVLSD